MSLISRVAITGGVGEGKTTVLEMLSSLGYKVASSDKVAREVLARPEVFGQVAALAGKPDITRDELRVALTERSDLRRQMNRLLHPLVIKQLVSENAQFVEVPLLVETCLISSFQRVWVVTCGEIIQLQRLIERYGSRAAAESIVKTQLPTRAKLPFADLVVRTNLPLATVRDLIVQVAEREFA